MAAPNVSQAKRCGSEWLGYEWVVGWPEVCCIRRVAADLPHLTKIVAMIYEEMGGLDGRRV